MCLQQFELIGAFVAQSSKRSPPLYQTSDHTWEEFVHALPKVVGFLRVVRFPPTGKVDRVCQNGVIVGKVMTLKFVNIDS